MAERHRLGGGSGLVEHRGVGDVESGQVADHRLEVEERFEAALRNFGLVRRVLRIPAGVFEDVALDDRRRDAVVVAEAEVGFEHLVLAGDGLELAQRIELGQGRGMSSGAVSRMSAGTSASIIASSESWPRVWSIAAVSSAWGPMCRRAKVSGWAKAEGVAVIESVSVGCGRFPCEATREGRNERGQSKFDFGPDASRRRTQ